MRKDIRMRKHTVSYLLSLAILFALSFYPIYMGITTLSSYIQYGHVYVASYPKYIIPYTPLCVALLVSVVLMPLLVRIVKKYALPTSSFLGLAVFLGMERLFEQIKVLEGFTVIESKALPLDAWQYSLCAATPEVLRTIGEPIYAQSNPAYKIHFYIIAIVILLAVLATVYGFYRTALENRRDRRRTLIAQLISVSVFIALCVLACFTAFWRNGTLNISSLSAVCMTVFFIVFGMTFGIYAGSFVWRKKLVWSRLLPAVVSALMAIVMYVGELLLTGGRLFRFGNGFLFSPIGGMPFAWIDIITIALSGVFTYLVMSIVSQHRNRTPMTTGDDSSGGRDHPHSR